MKAADKRAASRRMKGRYSSRLTKGRKGRSHSLFRTGPEFYRLAVESLAEYALITTDTERRISSWSGPAAAMFGYGESEIIGESISLLFTPEDIAAGIDRSEFAAALENGRESDERWHVRKDGKRLWCYGLSFPLKDENGVVRGFVKLIRDDSERKRREELLRENEERLRLAGESTGLGTFDFDVGKGALLLSARAAELFGLGEGGRSFGFEHFLEKVHSEDREGLQSTFQRCLAARTDRDADLEYRVHMPDGGVRWVRTLIRGFCDRGREEGVPPKRLIGTVVDVTAARRLQAEARRAHERLEQSVQERTARLAAFNKELETFAYSTSHDLRAPLRKIAAFSQAILESRESRLGAADRSRFERIRAAAATMQRLIDDTLALSRVVRKPLMLEDCDLAEMARTICGELRARAPDRRVEFAIAERAPAYGDRELLGIVLRNLLENAWKFTGRHPSARIEFGVGIMAGRPVYFVKDDGAGFDMRYAQKLFGAFRRLHAEGEFPGTGVGLGMAERIIERHRGRLWVEAQVEKGATFYFTLDTESE